MKATTVKYSGLERILNMDLTISIALRVGSDTEYVANIVRDTEDGLFIDEYTKDVWFDIYGCIVTEICDSHKEYDAIVNCFGKFIYINGEKYTRKCNVCNNGMNEGYVIDGGEGHICSPKCLYSKYTQAEWADMSDNDDMENYWTEWDDNYDCEYVLFNNQLISL